MGKSSEISRAGDQVGQWHPHDGMGDKRIWPRPEIFVSQIVRRVADDHATEVNRTIRNARITKLTVHALKSRVMGRRRPRLPDGGSDGRGRCTWPNSAYGGSSGGAAASVANKQDGAKEEQEEEENAC